jgi:hypothetical protein
MTPEDWMGRSAFRNFGAMPFVACSLRFSACFVGFVCATHRAIEQTCPVCRKARRQATDGARRDTAGALLA